MFIRKRLYNALKAQIVNAQAQTLHIRDVMAGALGVSHNGKRSIYDVYGYPQSYSFRLGYDAMRREGIANRVVSGVPASCWRNGFSVVDGTKDDPGEKIFDDEINLLNAHELFSRLERADTLNRMGAFSVLMVGVPDGLEFDQPIGAVKGDGYQSIYFRPFAEDGIQIAKYDMDQKSPRYGMPELYQLSVMGRGDTEQTVNVAAVMVHHSRVIHMAENRLDSDVEGIPALEPIYNRILDIDKATGGAAEAYFRNARGKIAFEIDPNFSSTLINDPTAKKDFDEAGQKFTNDWQDQITAVGAKVNSIATAHQSPLDTIKVALWEISGNTGIPIRVLTGEGSGQLAGSEDRLAYNALIQDRDDHVCAPWVRRLLTILDAAEMLDLPDHYFIEFPLDEPLNAMDQADLANKKADTLTKLTTAASTIAGDGIELQSGLDALGLDDIKVAEMDDLPPPPAIGDEMNPDPLKVDPDAEPGEPEPDAEPAADAA